MPMALRMRDALRFCLEQTLVRESLVRELGFARRMRRHAGGILLHTCAVGSALATVA